MIFNSKEFLLFLPVVFLIYWGLRGLKARNLFLIAASYVFYGWWNVRFVGLIALTTACSYVSGLAIERFQGSGSRRGALAVLWTNVSINLGILCLYKYFNFFSHSFAALLRALGMGVDDVTLNLVLPVGISFYTFQALAYSIDVYRGKVAATRDAVAFFAFISFFPQLVAGPVERASNLLPQFLSAHRFDYARAVDGMRQMLWGLFKKMVVADNCAMLVGQIMGDYASMGALNLWIGAVLFSFQIYGDFSGYSDIAVGVARMFGFNLMRNFNLPYFSRSIGEFWRRWHISLTTWFRDYVYYPLGGSRVGKPKTLRNTYVVFLLSGFWHGASWSYIGWGLYHALLLTPKVIRGRRGPKRGDELTRRALPSLSDAAKMALTFALVVIGRVLYRCDTMADALSYIGSMFNPLFRAAQGVPVMGLRPLAYCFMLVVVEWVTRFREHPLELPASGLLGHRAARWALYYLLFMAILIFSGDQKQFIYFQF